MLQCELCKKQYKSLGVHLTKTHKYSKEQRETYCQYYNIKYDDLNPHSHHGRGGNKNGSDNFKDGRNPAINHNGCYSPYSRKFIKYQGLSEDEIDKKIMDVKTRSENKRVLPNQIEYWLKKGFNENEAIEKISKSQSTFSLNKCIKKYGIKEGTEIFNNRQVKWKNTMNLKSDEEKIRISKAKNSAYSKISQKLFFEIYDIIKDKFNDIYFADLNEEYCIISENRSQLPDFCILDNKKIIEFYGDESHCNPKMFNETFINWVKDKAIDKWKYDEERLLRLKAKGFQVLVIWESDFKNNHDKTLCDCLDFLMDK